jgi:hypothetical protein
VVNNILYVNVPAFLANEIETKVFTTNLTKLNVTGNSAVWSKKFRAANLEINTANHGDLKLEGEYSISKIIQRGAGKIDINWINSKKLIVDSNSNGPIYLAGEVKDMLVKLMSNSYLDAHYLRAHKAVVMTTDKAEANVTVLDALSGYAIDHSNIYYYKRPPSLTVVTRDSGNVLHPDWLH